MNFNPVLDKVTVWCCGEEQTFNTRDEAIRFFMNAMGACEGAEKERYANVVTDLYDGQTLCIDDYDEYLLEHKDMVACPYCGRPMVDTGNKDELCPDCKSTFGHSLVTEL